MNSEIPSTAQVRLQLQGLPDNGLREVADKSGVPFTTLWKIRAGETVNPGIETVRKFYHFLAEPSAERSCAAIEPVAVQGA